MVPGEAPGAVGVPQVPDAANLKGVGVPVVDVGSQQRLSLSFGIVMSREGEIIGDALRRADQALYEAKRQGRSCAVIAEGSANSPLFGESRSMGLGAR